MDSIETLLKKTRFKQLIKMVIVSVIMIALVIGIIFIGDKKLATGNYRQLNKQLFTYHKIAAPNLQIDSQVVVNNDLFGGQVKTNRSKNVEGYIIPWSTLTSDYSWFSTSIDNNELLPGWFHDKQNSYEYDRQTKQKFASFYDPQIADYYDGVKNEVSELAEMSDHVAEMALSFDQPYTYSEIKEMVPKELHIVWYWAGLDQHEYDESGGPSGSVKYGFHLTDESSKKEAQEAFEQFVEDVTNYNESGGDEALTTIAKEYQGQTLEEAKFTGVMVTGETENFKSLQAKKWLRGASVGVIAKRVPYIQPSK